MTNYAQTERAALCDLFDELGPAAPTLCEGWTTYDLAAHLVIRERRPDASLGIVLKPLERWTEKVQQAAKRQTYSKLVEQVRGGPPRLSLYGLPAADASFNTLEYFVHHEDVRRAQPAWEPRRLGPAFEDTLWRMLQGASRAMLAKAPVGVTLRRPDGKTMLARPGSPQVTITGTPSELALYVFGRKNEALVELDGDEDAKRRLAGASLGI